MVTLILLRGLCGFVHGLTYSLYDPRGYYALGTHTENTKHNATSSYALLGLFLNKLLEGTQAHLAYSHYHINVHADKLS